MPSKSQPEKFNIPTSDWLKNWAASTSVSLGVKTVMAPVERIKLLYQAQGELLKSGRLKRPWTSYSDLISRTSQKEGLLSFWKGNATYLGRYTLSSGLALMVKDELLRVDYIGQYNNTYHNDMKDMSLHKNIIYGGLGGLIGMTFAYPLEYTRTRLVNDISVKGKEKEFKGLLDTIRKAYVSDGIIGLYRGFSMTIPTIFIYRGLEYGLYDYFCKNQTEGFYSTPQGKFIMAYIISNSITTLLYPFTTLRVRRIMTTGESTQYKSWLEIYKYVVATEGHKGLFRGMSANLIKNIGTSCVISFYDILSEQARRLNTDKFS